MDKLQLLGGNSYKIKGIGTVAHPLLKNIKEIGQEKYYYYLFLLNLKPDQLLDGIKDKETREIFVESKTDVFDFIIKNYNLRKDFTDALSFFFMESVFFNETDNNYIVGKYGLIDKELFPTVLEIVNELNCLSKQQEDNDYANAKALSIANKLKKAKEKREKTKDNTITISDMISSISAKHNSYNLLNIWDLNVYQLYDQFKRISLIDQIEINKAAILQGAEIKDIEHWASPMED